MPRNFYVYILQCGDGSLYTGYTANLPRRLAEHQAGKGAQYTRGRLPVALARCWMTEERRDAMKAERSIKQLKRRQKVALLSAKGGMVLSGIVLTAPGSDFLGGDAGGGFQLSNQISQFERDMVEGNP